MSVPSQRPRVLLSTETHRVAPEDLVVWNWPLRDDGWRAWAVIGVVLVVLFLLGRVVQSPRDVTLAAIAFAAALWRLWVPICWEIGLTGVTQNVLGYRRRIPWLGVARFDLTSHGVWLFPQKEASTRHALFIRYAGEERKIRACFDYYLGAWTTSGDATTQSIENPLR